MLKCALRVVAILAVVAPAALCQTQVNVDSKKVTYMLPTGIFVPQGETITVNATGTVTLTDVGGTGFFTVNAIGVIQTAPDMNTDRNFYSFLTNQALPPLLPPSPGQLKFPPGGTGATLVGAYGALVLGLSQNQCGATSSADFPHGFINPGTGAGPLPFSGGYIYLGVQRDNEVAVSGTYGVSISLSGSASPPLGCTSALETLDVYPNFVVPTSPYAVVNSQAVLASGGRAINGVAADGVTQLLIRSRGMDPTHTNVVAIADEINNVAPGNGEDGVLFSPFGGPVTAGAAVIPTIQEVNGINYIFVTYRAPVDYARSLGQDNATASRRITIVLFDATTNAVVALGGLSLMRPPIFFVHGLWGKTATWDEFDPSLHGFFTPDTLHTYRANYEKGNGDAVADNTPNVLKQAYDALNAFRAENQAAASQLDFIVHSMGGLISDTMPTLPAFRTSGNYGKGAIHRLITVDTPYLGSALAPGLNASQGSCKLLLGLTQGTVGGAIRDLTPGSAFLQNFNPVPPGYAKHAIASYLTPDQSADANSVINLGYEAISAVVNGASVELNDFCDKVFLSGNSPGPPNFSWTLFYNLPGDVYGGANDLIVSEKSELGPYLPGTTATTTFGLAHSNFIFFNHGFPGSLDMLVGSPKSNPANAIDLLNTPVGNTNVFVQ